jgi:hypothetical protein
MVYSFDFKPHSNKSTACGLADFRVAAMHTISLIQRPA